MKLTTPYNYWFSIWKSLEIHRRKVNLNLISNSEGKNLRDRGG